MEEPRVMPSTINYAEMLPMSIPAMASRRKFFPVNGSTFSRQGNRQIRIEIGHPSALLDASHSYVEARISNAGAQTFGPDLGGGNIFFENVRVEQGGKLLSYTQQSHRLHAAILAPVQTTSEGLATEGCTEAQRSYNTAGAASVLPQAAAATSEKYDLGVHNSDAFFANATTHRFSFPITSGLFSQDKLIPLPLVDPNAPITLVLDLAEPQDAGVWNAAPNVADIVVSEIAYIAHMIEVGPDVIQQFKQVQADMGGQLALSGQDFEYFSAVVPAGTGNQVALNCPARKRSIKSMFWCAQSNSLVNTAGPLGSLALLYNLSFAGSMSIESFQYQVGPVLYPAGNPVRCWNNTRAAAGAVVGHEFNRSEAVMELAKAVGTMSKTNPTGVLSTINYGTDVAGLASGDNGTAPGGGGATLAPASDEKYCVCPFGLSTDSFKRDIAESGIDTQTLAQDTNLLLNWAAGDDSGLEDKIVHMWTLFDQHYYFNADGSVSYSN